MSLHVLPAHVALIDQSGLVGDFELQRAAGALNLQLQQDFSPIWHAKATVGVYDPANAPANTWKVFLQRDLDEPGALGYHTDSLGQPEAYVDVATSRGTLDPEWTQTVSHELMEMVADPWGSRMHGGRLPAGLEESFDYFGLKTHHSWVSYLLEVADPPERFSYDVGGVAVSDFILPHWYHSNLPVEQPTSFAGHCVRARDVANGGYVSFHHNGDWWQVFNSNGNLTVQHLGRFDSRRFASLREFTDYHAREFPR
jgi:hypothetical protein